MAHRMEPGSIIYSGKVGNLLQMTADTLPPTTSDLLSPTGTAGVGAAHCPCKQRVSSSSVPGIHCQPGPGHNQSC